MSNFVRSELENGLPVIIKNMPGTNTITLLVMFGTGSRYENRENNGLSHFLEHMLFKGTTKRPTTLDIASELDSVGGEFNAFTSKEYTGYWVKVNKDKLSLALDVVSDIILNSKFDQEEIDREKGVIIEELNMYQDNPLMRIEDVFETCLYGDTPAGWDVIGTKENIKNFSRQDFVNYFQSQYGTKSAVVCLTGNVDVAEIKKVEQYFQDLQANDFQDKISLAESQSEPKILVENKATDQFHLALGVRAFPVGHPDEFVLKLISVILGGSMSSRLFTELRERRGLAYYVRTQAELYSDAGYLSTQSGLRLEDIEEAIKTILSEYAKLKKELVDEKELQRNKDLLRGRLAIQLESSDNVANWYAKQAVMREQLLHPEDFLAKINQVSAADIQRVAQDIFKDEKLNLAVIGPEVNGDRFKKLLKF